MPAPTLTLRNIKGSALTFTEMDTNLQNLATANITVTAAGTTTNIALNSGFTITAGSGVSLTNSAGNVTITSNVAADTAPQLGGNLNPSGFSITSNVAMTLATSSPAGSIVRFENTDTRENLASMISVLGKGNQEITIGVLGDDATVVGFGFATGSNFIQCKNSSNGDLLFLNYGNIKFNVAGAQLSSNGLSLSAGKQVLIDGVALTSYSNVQVGSYLAGNITVGNIAGNTNGFTLGYLEMPQVAAANVTLALTDSGKHFYGTSASITVTIPNHANVAFNNGTVISLVNNSSGNLIIGRQNSVSLYLGGNATSAGRTITSYGVATLIKVDNNTWFVNGSGVV